MKYPKFVFSKYWPISADPWIYDHTVIQLYWNEFKLLFFEVSLHEHGGFDVACKGYKLSILFPGFLFIQKESKSKDKDKDDDAKKTLKEDESKSVKKQYPFY